MSMQRYALRTLWHSPWYSATVIFVLGIGIALSAVVFAVVDGVLFKPLPYSRIEELRIVQPERSSAPSSSAALVSFVEIDAWAAAIPGVPLTAMSKPRRFRRSEGHQYWAADVDERFFDVLGIRPLIGGFSPEDFDWYQPDQGRGVRPVLVSYRFWQTELGGAPDAIGRIDGSWKRGAMQWGERIVGVLPLDFVFPLDSDEPQPEILSPIARGFRGPLNTDYRVMLRAPSGTDVVRIRERLLDGTRRAALAAPPRGHQREAPFDGVRLIPAVDELGRLERPAFAITFAGAAVLLLLACVNVAGLTAARNVERRRALAVRRALGASRGVLVRGLMYEIGVLGAAAAALAALLAKPMLVWTIAVLPPTVTLLKAPAVDARVVLACAAFALVTTALVGLWTAPVATRMSGASPPGALSGTVTRVGRRSTSALLAAQVALGFVLLTAGALTVTSLAAAWRADTGYRRERMILVEAYIREYSTGAEATVQLTQLGELLSRLPGIERAASSSIQPFFESSTQRAFTSLVPSGWTGGAPPAALRKVSAEFFEVMNIRLVEGRWPASGEWAIEQPVAIVSETAARMFWPGRSAVGQLLVPGNRQDTRSRAVIAVVGDTRYTAQDREGTGDVYTPDRFEPGRTGVFYHLRTAGDASASVPLVVQTLRARNVFANQVSTHEDALFASLKHRALPAWLFGSLGLAALLLSGVGILGLLAMSAAQRTRELGIRVALGATTGRVIRLLMGEQMPAVGSGLLAGAAISLWTVRFAESQLYGVRAYDPAVWSAVAAAVVAVAVVGTLVPSLRAARVNPVEALRAE
jgi:putative ABC transport system permease protein